MMFQRKLKYTVCALFVLLTSELTLAADGDRMDLKKLEDEYWSAKDKDMAVVQNRTYTKAGRPFLSLGYGPLVNDANATGRMTDVSAGYYFSERYGVELAYETGNLQDNDATTKYISRYGSGVDHNYFRDYKSVNFLWVPFYAKMSFLDSTIVYFDMQFAAGIGSMDYSVQEAAGSQNESALGYNFDFTQQLFFSQHLAARLDIKNKWSTQDTKDYSTGASTGSTMKNDTSVLLGLTFFW